MDLELNKLPITSIIHMNNHTRTKHVCKISSNHIINQTINDILIVTNNNKEFSNLNPGVYNVKINNEDYYLDLYIFVGRSDRLIIENESYAYTIVGNKTYPLYLYKKLETITNSSYTELENTVNDKLDMVLINGKSYIQENNDGYKNINSLYKIKIDSFISNEDIEATLYDVVSLKELYLKNNIKSLPNGINDIMILNIIQNQYHVIYKTARKILTGYEDWKLIEQYSFGDNLLFFLKDETVKISVGNNNLNSSHFIVKDGVTICNNINENAISTGFSESILGNGIFIRISKTYIMNHLQFKDENLELPNTNTDIVTYFKKFLAAENYNSRPFIIEYELNNYIYKTLLIDEKLISNDYYIQTFFPITQIIVGENENLDISYFYKVFK